MTAHTPAHTHAHAHGQESPGWISLLELFLSILKIYRNVNSFGKIDWSMNAGAGTRA